MDIYCPNSNKTLDSKVDCSLTIVSQDLNDAVNLDNNTYSFTGDYYNYFGIKSTNDTCLNETTALTGLFILPNTEFKFDADLKGFMLNVVNAGSIRINVCFLF